MPSLAGACVRLAFVVVFRRVRAMIIAENASTELNLAHVISATCPESAFVDVFYGVHAVDIAEVVTLVHVWGDIYCV